MTLLQSRPSDPPSDMQCSAKRRQEQIRNAARTVPLRLAAARNGEMQAVQAVPMSAIRTAGLPDADVGRARQTF